MALDNYDNLFKTISKRIERGTSLDTEIADFIDLAEIEMLSNPTESLKINDAETVEVLTTSDTVRILALPDGFKKSRDFSITLPDGVGKLTYRTPDQMVIRRDKGVPSFYTVQGNNIAFDIIPDETYDVTLDYFKNFIPLTVANQTNIILDKYPNIYLFGALRHAFLRSQDYQQEAMYTDNFASAIQSANLSELEQRNGNMPQITVNWAP